MSGSRQIHLPSLEATRRLANALASCIRPPMTIALVGDLGTGKTQLVRFLCEKLGVPSSEVTSPTYVLLQRYTGCRGPIYHLDFYRLESAAQVWDLGIDELYEQPVLILIEWADKFPECLPEDYLRVELHSSEDPVRTSSLTAMGSRSLELLEMLPV